MGGILSKKKSFEKSFEKLSLLEKNSLMKYMLHNIENGKDIEEMVSEVSEVRKLVNTEEVKKVMEFVGSDSRGVYLNALMAAAEFRKVQSVEYLLDKVGVNPNIIVPIDDKYESRAYPPKNTRGQNALHFCVRHTESNVLTKLEQTQINVRYPNAEKIAELLCERMSREAINQEDWNNMTPLDHAQDLNRTQIEKIIKNAEGVTLLDKQKQEKQGGGMMLKDKKNNIMFKPTIKF